MSPAELDELLKVLRAHDVSGYEATTPDGHLVRLTLAPRLGPLEGSGIEVSAAPDYAGPGGWKTR